MKLEVFVLGFAQIGEGATTTFIGVSFIIVNKFSNKQTLFFGLPSGAVNSSVTIN
jgi:hypothetical protein